MEVNSDRNSRLRRTFSRACVRRCRTSRQRSSRKEKPSAGQNGGPKAGAANSEDDALEQIRAEITKLAQKKEEATNAGDAQIAAILDGCLQEQVANFQGARAIPTKVARAHGLVSKRRA